MIVLGYDLHPRPTGLAVQRLIARLTWSSGPVRCLLSGTNARQMRQERCRGFHPICGPHGPGNTACARSTHLKNHDDKQCATGVVSVLESNAKIPMPWMRMRPARLEITQLNNFRTRFATSMRGAGSVALSPRPNGRSAKVGGGGSASNKGSNVSGMNRVREPYTWRSPIPDC